MYSFADASQDYRIASHQAETFNQSHDLGIILPADRTAKDAQSALEAIGQPGLVYVEMPSYEQERVSSNAEGPVVHCAGNVRGPGVPTLLQEMPYSSLYFRELRRQEPVHFAAMEANVLEAVNGTPIEYTTHLFFGLLARECLFVPGDAHDGQLLPSAVQELPWRINRAGRLDILNPHILSSEIQRQVRTAVNDRHDMNRFRDVALVNNIVELEDRPYRQAMGVAADAVLPSYIIRGNAHRRSLEATLTDQRLDYKLCLYDPPKDGTVIAATFAPNQHTDDEYVRTITNLLQTMLQAKEVSPFHAEACEPLAEKMRKIGVLASRSPAILDRVRELLIASHEKQDGGRLRAWAQRKRFKKMAMAVLQMCDQEQPI